MNTLTANSLKKFNLFSQIFRNISNKQNITTGLSNTSKLNEKKYHKIVHKSCNNNHNTQNNRRKLTITELEIIFGVSLLYASFLLILTDDGKDSNFKSNSRTRTRTRTITRTIHTPHLAHENEKNSESESFESRTIYPLGFTHEPTPTSYSSSQGGRRCACGEECFIDCSCWIDGDRPRDDDLWD